ncbi:MAG: ACP S-malonyltransferase [Phycisphaerales bacterium]|nr:ACP S-malonyltransferase [Phycisphaerales bacterium]
MSNSIVVLGPGQGAQSVGMGRAWCDASTTAAAVFARADAAIDFSSLGGSLSKLCFDGPADTLNRTDVCQPALFTCGIASFHALQECEDRPTIACCAGLSLGEYTALAIAGAFTFEDGLRLVAARGRLMQAAAEASRGSMVALIGADEAQAQAVCDGAAQGDVLVLANFNATGQIVLSGHATACARAIAVAQEVGCRAATLQVAGAFHSPLMAPAAEALKNTLEQVEFHPLKHPVWSNVTAQLHDPTDAQKLKKLLVDQLVCPVRWSQSMLALNAELSLGSHRPVVHELAPGSVLKGLMRRIDKSCEVISHDKPDKPDKPDKH